MIQIEHLRKSYGPLLAVDDVSFRIEDGETFGLLGPNGAGKTTIVSMLVGVLRPDAGDVKIDGDLDPTRLDIRRRIGNAPQSLSIYTDMTAEENLKFFARLYGIYGRKLKERLEWSLEFSGLKERRSSLARTYSGGMQRRLNLACALIHDPSVLVLDEPTVGVDPQSRNQIFESIESLKKEGRTIVYTTHYMEEAERLCDRVAILDHGRVLDIDTVDRLIAKHGGVSVIEAELARIPGTSMKLPGRLEGTHLRIETDRPMEDFAAIASTGLQFNSLKIERADLEAVFLNLTGRSLRD